MIANVLTIDMASVMRRAVLMLGTMSAARIGFQ
jgi:hypothetical protein